MDVLGTDAGMYMYDYCMAKFKSHRPRAPTSYSLHKVLLLNSPPLICATRDMDPCNFP